MPCGDPYNYSLQIDECHIYTCIWNQECRICMSISTSIRMPLLLCEMTIPATGDTGAPG